MNVLAVDTSLAACSVAIRVGGNLVARRYAVPGTGHAELLMTLVEQARSECSLAYGDFDLLAVTVGPGTFTGVRAGIAAVRGLALVSGVPALGIGTLHALAAGALQGGAAGPGEPVFVALDARHDEVYFQAFAPGAIPLGEPAIGTLTEAAACIPAGSVVIGSGAPLLASIARGTHNVRASHGTELPDAAIVAGLAEHAASQPGFHPPQPPAPQYVRPPHVRLP